MKEASDSQYFFDFSRIAFIDYCFKPDERQNVADIFVLQKWGPPILLFQFLQKKNPGLSTGILDLSSIPCGIDNAEHRPQNQLLQYRIIFAFVEHGLDGVLLYRDDRQHNFFTDSNGFL